MMATKYSRSGSLHNDSSFEYDAVPETSPTNTLQRGVSVPPSSPKEHSTWSKIRRSFTPGKYEKVKQQLKETKTENEALRIENDRLEQENAMLKRGMAEILSNNPFHVKNLQLGDRFTVVNNTDEELAETLQELDDLVTKLTNALEKMFEDMTKTEQEFENNKVLLAEIQETLVEYSKKFEQKTKIDTKSFNELKKLLVDLQSDRSDTQVITDCVEELKDYIQRRMVVDYETLPQRVQTGITRLVNKFGDMQWQEFVSRVGINPQSIDCHSQPTEQNSGSDVESLDKNRCSKIMAEWVNEPDHTADMFMELLHAIDRERTDAAKQRFKLSMIEEKKHGKGMVQYRKSTVSQNSNTSSESTPSHRERMRRYASQQLGEHRTQTAHAVELCKTVLDKLERMETMKQQIHELYEAHVNSASNGRGDAAHKLAQIEEYV